jgi:hypothetical protein
LTTEASNRQTRVKRGVANIVEPQSPFRRGWITAVHRELWNIAQSYADKNLSTYYAVPYSSLPSVDQATDDLLWLDSVTPELRRVIETPPTLCSTENEIANLEAIIEKAKCLHLNLPQAFVRFMRDPELQRKVPTPTACRLELSDDLVPLNNMTGHYLVRFMNDSQSCVMWYLWLRPQVEASVVASDYFFEKEIFDAMEYEDISYHDLASAAFACSDTFTEFLFRFWIENTIWYSLTKQVPLSALQEAYRSQITKKL